MSNPFMAARLAAKQKKSTQVDQTAKGPSVRIAAEVTDEHIILKIPRVFAATDMRATTAKPGKLQLPFVAFKANLGSAVPITVQGIDGGESEEVYSRTNLTGNLFMTWEPAQSSEDLDGEEDPAIA